MDLASMTDAEKIAECERIAPLIGINLTDTDDFNDWYLDQNSIWINRAEQPRKFSRMSFGRHDGKFRILTHYLPDFLYHHLGIKSIKVGQAILPDILADEHASGLWRSLLSNPNDEGVLSILKDRLEEMGIETPCTTHV